MAVSGTKRSPSTRFHSDTIDRLVVVQLDPRPILDFIIRAGDVVLKNGVPLLQAELLGTRPGLRGDELLQVRDGVVGVALDPDFLAWKSISVSRGVRRTRDIIKHDE